VVPVTVPLFDSHCHLDLEPLRSGLPKFLDEAAAAEVSGFVMPGVHPDGWPGMEAIAAGYPQILPAFGIHPMHGDCVNDQTLGRLRELAGHSVAIGETGLDPAYAVPLEQQEQAFREQIRVALACGLPLLIHCRKVFQRLLAIMHEEGAGQVGGIMHAYSGSVEIAREFIKIGFAISISGTVTWDNAVKPLHIARELPLEYLVLETDAPDMTPQRYRGRFNRPAWLLETAQRVAEVRGIALDEVARVTTENARRVLRLDGDAVF
jgi:TatD DNase family protein